MSNRINKLYLFAYDAAEVFGPNSWQCGLFVTELKHTDRIAYEILIEEIYINFIGG